jgi:hypothetical protein
MFNSLASPFKFLVLLGTNEDRKVGTIAVSGIINQECADGVFVFDPYTQVESAIYQTRAILLNKLATGETLQSRFILESLQEASVEDYLNHILPKLKEGNWVIACSWVDDIVDEFGGNVKKAFDQFGRNELFKDIGNRFLFVKSLFSRNVTVTEIGQDKVLTTDGLYKLVDVHSLKLTDDEVQSVGENLVYEINISLDDANVIDYPWDELEDAAL